MFNQENKTRIESEYSISAWGTILNPGRYDSQTWLTVLCDELTGDGFSDYELTYQEDGIGEYSCLFKLDENEQVFVGAYGIMFVQDSMGFCYTVTLTESEFNDILTEYELD